MTCPVRRRRFVVLLITIVSCSKVATSFVVLFVVGHVWISKPDFLRRVGVLLDNNKELFRVSVRCTVYGVTLVPSFNEIGGAFRREFVLLMHDAQTLDGTNLSIPQRTCSVVSHRSHVQDCLLQNK